MTRPIVHAAPEWLRDLADDDAAAAVPEAVRWNLRGMLAWWEQYPGSMDFLDPAADNHALKALQTRLYREALGASLPSPGDAPLRILDAACGIGRFAVPLARDGHTVHGIDACLPSLEAAARHGAGLDGLRLTWGDVRALDALGEAFAGEYDLVLAFELLCYLPDPGAVAASLASRLRPGGRLIASVEAWPGALLSDAAGVRIEDLPEVRRTRVLAERDERWVRAGDRREAAAILRGAGLAPALVAGTHYIPDGPLAALLEHERVGEVAYDDAICEAELRLRADVEMGALPRAWLLVGERPR